MGWVFVVLICMNLFCRLIRALYSETDIPSRTFFIFVCRDTGPLSPIEQVRRRIKRRRRAWTDPRNILGAFALLSFAGTIIFVYLRASQGLP